MGVHQADLPGLLDDVLGPGPVLVVVPRDLADVLLREAVCELAQVLLLVGEGEVNHGCLLLLVRGHAKRTRLVLDESSRLIDWSVSQCLKRTRSSGGQA